MAATERQVQSGGGRAGWGALLVSVWVLFGCKDSRGPTTFVVEKAPIVSDSARVTAERLYTERCAQCHGVHGDGDGPMAPAVRPRPQRLTDRVWQANVTNARLRKVVLYGGGAVNKSPFMPGLPELAGQPEVLDGLIAVIRSLAAAN